MNVHSVRCPKWIKLILSFLAYALLNLVTESLLCPDYRKLLVRSMSKDNFELLHLNQRLHRNIVKTLCILHAIHARDSCDKHNESFRRVNIKTIISCNLFDINSKMDTLNILLDASLINHDPTYRWPLSVHAWYQKERLRVYTAYNHEEL